MRRKGQVAAASIAALLAVAALARLAAQQPAAREVIAPHGRAVIDMAARRVRVPAEPLHVLSLATLATDTVLRLGEGRRLAAMDSYGRVVPGTQSVPIIGKGSAISREQVLARRIDLAFIWWYEEEAAALLESLGVPTIRVRSERANDVPQAIRLVGASLNRRAAAEGLAIRVERFLRARSPRSAVLARPRVYLQLYGPFRTMGRGTYVDDLLELAGAANIACTANGTVLLSAEQLLAADPDVLLYLRGDADADELRRLPGLASLRAIRAGHVVALDRYRLVAGAGLPEAIEDLRNKLTAVRKGRAHAVSQSHLP